MSQQNSIKGRGTPQNPKNRFFTQNFGYDEIDDYEQSSKTEIIKDSSQSILSYNNSPDIPYNVGLIHIEDVNTAVPIAMHDHFTNF